MSRAVKVIPVEGRGEVTVKEISPYGLLQAYRAGDGRVEQMVALFDDALMPGVQEIQTWYPSEIEQVVDAFLAVNGSFFVIARKLKVDGLITEIATKMASNLPPLFAGLFSTAMQGPGITAGVSS